MVWSENTHLLCKGKYHCMAELLFVLFAYAELVTYCHVWLSPNQSNRRSAEQWDTFPYKVCSNERAQNVWTWVCVRGKQVEKKQILSLEINRLSCLLLLPTFSSITFSPKNPTFDSQSWKMEMAFRCLLAPTLRLKHSSHLEIVAFVWYH